ncbi:MAG TPA: hypothetical protein PKW55_07735 [Spirochaetota bacterium]|nr:hypothetical protein [Spirochaetota bacterium]HOM38676.1 hypothetical protein [Spirochaetota bacterium]
MVGPVASPTFNTYEALISPHRGTIIIKPKIKEEEIVEIIKIFCLFYRIRNI